MEEFNPPNSKISFKSDKRYHVFLSFRGKDVRMSLVHHLFRALSEAGLQVFLDSDKLKKGEIIWLGLERAIESSAIRIPIFSQGYADSAWCLKEAAAMLKTPGLIIPLFYDVDPCDVRYPLKDSSPYKKSFVKHYGHPDRYSGEEVDGWKSALEEICSRSGWSMEIAGGFEALVKTVVKDVIETLDRVPLEVAKHPVGMDSVKEALIQKLNLNSGEGVVKAGLWGMGGIGKTTTAKAVFNQVYADFDAASFVFNVGTTAAEGMGLATGLTKMQKKILKDLSTYGGEVDSVDEGISLFKDHLGGKRMLLILDDVDAKEQSNALVGDWLAPGSRVIITSRNQHILNDAGVSSECIQLISGLEINEGLKLFSWHAFLRESPCPGYEKISKGIVEACKGHPLSLEVIGSFLYDKQNDPDCWTEALHNITRNPAIHKILYISYNALTEEEKEIFLDIACFFVGEEKTYPIVFWKSLYKMVNTAISNLSMKLLIKIDNKGVLDMHDHLREMGRGIAQREGTRVWEASHLSAASNNINLSRIRLNGGNSQRLEMLYRPGLRYLHLQYLPIEGMTKDTLARLPPSLIWLRLEHCPFTTGKKPPLSRFVGNIWQLSKKAIEKPHRSIFVGNIWQLRFMQLKYCDDLDSLSISSLFSLPNIQLQHLDLKGCEGLNKLFGTIGNLSRLEHLDLFHCTRLNNISPAIGNLSQLKNLNLSWCRNLRILPDTVGNLSKLQHLDLGGCERLNSLPDTIGNLSQLQQLSLRCCRNLRILPDTIGSLSQLEDLDMSGCRNLKILPDTIGNLSELQYLYLRSCRSLNILPDTIGNLSRLQHLDLSCCRNFKILLHTIGDLSQLEYLNLSWCRDLKFLPDTIGKLLQLQQLDLRWCERIKNLPDTIGSLSQLQRLDLRWCRSLNLHDTIVNLSHLSHLQRLNLSFVEEV